MATKNIVPNDDSEGQLGTSSKFWSLAHLDGLNIGNDAAANLVFTPSASDTITLAAAANGAFTITTVDAAAAAANVGFVVDGAFDVDAAGAVTIDGSSITIGGDSDVAIDIDSSTLDIDTSGAITVDAAGTASDIAISTAHTAGTAFLLDANADAGSIVQIDAGILDLNVTGATTLNGTTTTITSSSADILGLATTHASTGYLEFFYNTTTIAGYLGNGSSLGGSATDFILRSESGALKFTTNGGNLALTLDTSQDATFAGDIAVSGGIVTLGNAANASINPLATSSSAGKALTVAGGNAGSGTDLNAGGLFLLSGNSTGTGTGVIEFYTAPPAGSSGTGSNSSVKRLTIGADGNSTFEGGVAVTGASSLPLSDSSALNAGIQIPTNAQLGFGNGDGSKPDFGFAVQGTSGSAKLNIFCGTGGTDVDAFIDTNGFIHAAALFLGGESTPNTLDDYEEGTWDPVFVGSGGNQSVDNGYYRKVGSLCYLTCAITLDANHTSGETSSISGLPFTAATASNVINAVSFYNVSTSFTGNNIPLGLIPSGSAQIALYITNGTNYKFNAVFNTSQVGSIEFSVTYITV